MSTEPKERFLMIQTNTIAAKAACYIKLGRAGELEARCLQEGTLRVRYYKVPHEMALQGDRDSIRKLYLQESSEGTASDMFFVLPNVLV
jgi:hypothetical protein